MKGAPTLSDVIPASAGQEAQKNPGIQGLFNSKKGAKAQSGLQGLFAALLNKAGGEAAKSPEAQGLSARKAELLEGAAQKRRTAGKEPREAGETAAGLGSRQAERAHKLLSRAAFAETENAKASKEELPRAAGRLEAKGLNRSGLAAKEAEAASAEEEAAAETPAKLKAKAAKDPAAASEVPQAVQQQASLQQTAASKAGVAAPAKAEEDPRARELEKGSQSPSGGEPRISLLDLRRERRKADSAASAKDGAEPAASASQEPARVASEASGQTRELVLELGAKEGSSLSEIPSRAGAEKAGGSDFSSVFADKLRESWNGEIVKSAQIVLRDGDSGTIKLRLRPESLGNVKIELNLAENSISGRIVVESDEAKTAFEKSMADLRDAFMDGGFESAKLEVAVDSGGAGARGGFGDAQGGSESSGPYWSERRRSEAFGEAVPVLARSYSAEQALDILA